jgi:hypothetical protein
MLGCELWKQDMATAAAAQEYTYVQPLIARLLKELVHIGVDGVITVKTEAAESRRRTPVWVSGHHVYVSV